MFSCRPCARPGCCFGDIYAMRWWIFAKPLSVVNLGRKMNWLGLGVTGQRSRSHHDQGPRAKAYRAQR